MHQFAEKLLVWYQENKRCLPWRKTKDPYKIWISEIILQQTRVVQGYAYYCKFIERFPDVFTLAEADEDEVMKYWQGLGYYSRARNLHEAAQVVVHNGQFPTTYEEVRKMKGVGDYTAAAICSFAYDLPYAVVDGNVYRVLSRWMGIEVPIDSTKGKKMFAELAQELIDKKHPALYNQAIMDFGAIQCTPSSPNCLFCPFSDSCVALQKRKVEVLPIKVKKIRMTERFFHYFFIRVGAMTFINKRGKGDIWQNLYEIPLLETDSVMKEEELFASSAYKCLMGEARVLKTNLIAKGVRHILSHQVIYADCYELVLAEDTDFGDRFQKVLIEDLQNFAVPRLVSHFFSLILSTNL